MAENTSPTEPENRPNTGRFQPGQSGNPGGRPRRTDQHRHIDELARAVAPEAIQVVATLMRTGTTERTRLAAALAVIERAHGKPGECLAEPLSIDGSASLNDQARQVMAAAIGGTITPTQANALLSGLSTMARIYETAELEARLAALEATLGNRR